jgi:hypothetical protein
MKQFLFVEGKSYTSHVSIIYRIANILNNPACDLKRQEVVLRVMLLTKLETSSELKPKSNNNPYVRISSGPHDRKLSELPEHT